MTQHVREALQWPPPAAPLCVAGALRIAAQLAGRSSRHIRQKLYAWSQPASSQL